MIRSLQGFGSNQAMLQSDAAQATQILSGYLSGENQVNQKQQTLTNMALALLAAAVVVRLAFGKN